MKEYEVLVGYNRGCNLEIDYHKIIRVVAGSPKEASELVDNYRIDKMFDDIEEDYLEDSLFSCKVL